MGLLLKLLSGFIVRLLERANGERKRGRSMRLIRRQSTWPLVDVCFRWHRSWKEEGDVCFLLLQKTVSNWVDWQFLRVKMRYSIFKSKEQGRLVYSTPVPFETNQHPPRRQYCHSLSWRYNAVLKHTPQRWKSMSSTLQEAIWAQVPCWFHRENCFGWECWLYFGRSQVYMSWQQHNPTLLLHYQLPSL